MDKVFSSSPGAIYQREWRKKNPEKNKNSYTKWRLENRDKYLASQRLSDTKRKGTPRRHRHQRDADLKRWCTKYGITVETFYTIRDKQNNLCWICQDPPAEGRRLYIDHDHSVSEGGFRGLLCNTCNGGLGLFRDNTTLLRRAVEYLERKTSQ